VFGHPGRDRQTPAPGGSLLPYARPETGPRLGPPSPRPVAGLWLASLVVAVPPLRPTVGGMVLATATAAGGMVLATATAAGGARVAATRAAGPPPAFSAHVRGITAGDVPYTWRPGCPVGPARLREIQMTFWGFDHRAHTGRMVVNAAVVTDVVRVFRALYQARFPLREMVPEDAYHGNDNRAAAADDTSGFNCRYAVAPGAPRWSVHAYGEAIDVNDVQNPYIDGRTVIPPAGRAYLERTDVRPGMAVPGGALVRAFAAVGWYWGGRWTATPDYQHFSLTGG